MPRVAIDGVVYEQQRTGGISRAFNELLPRIAGQHGDITIVLHMPPFSIADVPKGRGVLRIRDCPLRPGQVFRTPCRQLSIARIRLLRPRVFHSTYYTPPYWPGLRSVVTVHDFLHERFPGLLSEPGLVDRKRRVIESADAVIAVSRSTREAVLEHTNVDASRVSVVYHGVGGVFALPCANAEEGAEFRRRHGVKSAYWLYVGDRAPYKNFDTLLRAFVRAAARSEMCLLAVGGNNSGLEAYQAALLVRHRAEERVRIIPYLSDQDLRMAYSCAAAFVFPSLGEGFGLPLLEAMACNTPVVASDIPVFREIAGDAAMYFDPHDAEALASALTEVGEGSARDKLIGAGQLRVRAFSWDVAASRIAEIYRALG